MADTRASLKELLEGEGNFVLEIAGTESFGAFFKKGTRRKRFRIKEFLVFNQEFAVLIKAGLPIVAALDAIIEKGGQSELHDLRGGVPHLMLQKRSSSRRLHILHKKAPE